LQDGKKNIISDFGIVFDFYKEIFAKNTFQPPLNSRRRMNFCATACVFCGKSGLVGRIFSRKTMRFSWCQKHPINISLKGHFLKRTFPKAFVCPTSAIIVLYSEMLLRQDFRLDGTGLNATRESNTPFLGKDIS